LKPTTRTAKFIATFARDTEEADRVGQSAFLDQTLPFGSIGLFEAKLTLGLFMQICYGEFDWPDEYSKRRFLRGEFMNAVAEHEPEVCKSLYGGPLVLFSRLKCYDRNLSWEDFMADKTTGEQAFIDSLLKWSRDWMLDADWCRETAYESVVRYHSAQPSSSLSSNQFHHRFDLPTRGDLAMTLPPPKGLEEYWPLFLSRDDYLNQVNNQVLAEIHAVPLLRLGEPSHRQAFARTILAAAENYCAEVEKYLEKEGYVRPKAAEKRNLALHLEWAVLYQMEGLGWSRIANMAAVNPSAVQKAVNELLRLINLPQRPIARGRPHGSKDSASVSILRKLGR